MTTGHPPASPVTDWPVFSQAERERRWRLTQELIARNELDALIVYGERDTVGQPHFAPDAWLTNDRPGNAVLVPRGEDPHVLVNLHIAVGDHLEALRRRDHTWITPDRMYAGSRMSRPGAGRSAEAIVTFLADRRLARGRIGVVGLAPFGVSYPDGVIPYGTLSGVIESCPDASFVAVDREWHAMVAIRSEEELAAVRHAARAGEAMCEAMVERAKPGVAEHELYAAAMEACFLAGGTTHWLIIVLARGGESVAWGPPAWTYRPQQPRELQEGDVVLAELFPTYGLLEAQQQLTIAVGEVHPEVLRAAEIARQSYEAGLDTLRPGIRFGALAEALEAPVREAGAWNLTPHVHSLNPLFVVGGCGLPSGLPGAEAYGNLGGLATQGGELVLSPGHTLAIQPNCVIGRRRVNVGGTVVVTASGPEELNSMANSLQRV